MESRAIARVADRKAVAPKGHASGRANGQSKVSWGTTLASPIGRGVGSPNRARWRNARHEPTPPRQGYPLAEGDPKGALDIMGTILFKPYQDLGEGLFFDN